MPGKRKRQAYDNAFKLRVIEFPENLNNNSAAEPKAEQTYFAIRGGKAKRVDAASVVEAASVDILTLDPPRTYAADLLRESTRGEYRLGVVARIDAECHGDTRREHTIRRPRTYNLAVA
ncbi:hypothetical protein DPMN_052552 [Dreissena polymorpha]|uniref:Uncharacterized protein n=1 Tax=Dreissena polymorpha TaxID=45954 RepID=A0A9D4CLP6_DREPO|nr:hypothetical protein DPMN_052552 [Dreissena polymorpha]